MSDLKIFTTTIEDAALELVNAIAEHPYFENQKIRIMPDTHAGNAIVVGFTCPVGPYLNPEHVGSDIGCGIETELFDKLLPAEQFPLFEQRVRNAIPMGKDLNAKREFDLKEFCKFVRKELSRAAQSSDGLVCEVPFSNERDISAWCKSLNLDEKTFYKSIGTLGGGNHFIELDYNEEQELMLRPSTRAAATSDRRCATAGPRRPSPPRATCRGTSCRSTSPIWWWRRPMPNTTVKSSWTRLPTSTKNSAKGK